MRSILFAAALIAAGVADAPSAQGKDGPDDLVGGYTIVAGEKFGQPEPKEKVDGTTVRIAKDGIVVLDKEKKEVYAQTYTIDTSKTPWSITMKSKITPYTAKDQPEAVAKGLIEKEGDTVRLIYALPGGEMPTEFKTKAKQLMFVMKNENK